MKLYYSPGACSMACHIVLEEMGLKYQTESVNLRTKETASGDFKKINPKGQVPTLQTDKGDVLTEGPIIMQYLSDLHPEKGLFPKFGSWDRYQAMEWFNFVSTELHKGYSPLFGADRIMPNKESAELLKTATRQGLQHKIALVEERLKTHPYMLGKEFSAVDAYLFTILNWSGPIQVDLTSFPHVIGFMEKVKNRPAVQKVMQDEGLSKK